MLQPALVELRSVTKTFGGFTAVDQVSLSIRPGEFFALLGASGCGKTTLMRMLAGFETPDSGEIMLEGVPVSGQPPHRRPINMMFQSYALFPHMRVAENIAFGLKQEGLPRAEIARRVDELLALVKLEGLARRKPAELSGGQRQRVALARALAKRPKLLLLDEPLSALDRKLREATQRELKDLQARLGTAFLVVTHDQEEAMTMADRIAVMDRGRIVQIATPRDLYESPINRKTAQFVGDISLIEGHADRIEGGAWSVSGPVGEIRVQAGETAVTLGAGVAVALRPEKIKLSRAEPGDPGNTLPGTVSAVSYFGGMTMVHVAVDGLEQPIKVSIANTDRAAAEPLNTGERVWLSWAVDAGVLLTG